MGEFFFFSRKVLITKVRHAHCIKTEAVVKGQSKNGQSPASSPPIQLPRLVYNSELGETFFTMPV